jgi:Caleosin related protein
MHDAVTNADVIVADGLAHEDLDGDGRIARTDEMQTVRQRDLVDAARYIHTYFDSRVPGVRIPGSSIVSNGALNVVERREFERAPGVSARRSLLLEHLAFFDRSNSGRVSLRHNYDSWRALGFSVIRACTLTLGSAVVFGGGLHNGFSIDLGGIHARRPKGSTGIYDEDGNLDEARLSELCRVLGAAAVEGVVSHDRARATLSEWVTLGSVPRRQFESFFALAEKMNGSRTITLNQVRWLYDGSLFWRASSMADPQGRRAL